MCSSTATQKHPRGSLELCPPQGQGETMAHTMGQSPHPSPSAGRGWTVADQPGTVLPPPCLGCWKSFGSPAACLPLISTCCSHQRQAADPLPGSWGDPHLLLAPLCSSLPEQPRLSCWSLLSTLTAALLWLKARSLRNAQSL